MEDERKEAITICWGLCEWTDCNVGRILKALDESGLEADVIYASDHGDNVGVPLIAAFEGIKPGKCHTPVWLLDPAESIPHHFGLEWQGNRPGRPLQEIAAEPSEPKREIISQYHGVRAVSGSYMLRKGRWKYLGYAGFELVLFDLNEEPEELANVAANTHQK